MKLKNLFLWNLRFQAKYGFYFLYAVLTVIYVVALFAIPEDWSENIAAILIFSDPAAMGLFFMGAIVLLEKSQHIPNAFAVSPTSAAEYVIAEVASLSTVSLVVATILALSASVENLPLVLLGTLLSSVVFTLFGIIIATGISSLNQFIIYTVPIEAVCFLPAILHLLKITPDWLQYYPTNVCMDLIAGNMPSLIGIAIVIATIIALFFIAKHCVVKMWGSVGGVKI